MTNQNVDPCVERAEGGEKSPKSQAVVAAHPRGERAITQAEGSPSLAGHGPLGAILPSPVPTSRRGGYRTAWRDRCSSRHLPWAVGRRDELPTGSNFTSMPKVRWRRLSPLERPTPRPSRSRLRSVVGWMDLKVDATGLLPNGSCKRPPSPREVLFVAPGSVLDRAWPEKRSAGTVGDWQASIKEVQ
jgi:hypothetical protein